MMFSNVASYYILSPCLRNLFAEDDPSLVDPIVLVMELIVLARCFIFVLVVGMIAAFHIFLFWVSGLSFWEEGTAQQQEPLGHDNPWNTTLHRPHHFYKVSYTTLSE